MQKGEKEKIRLDLEGAGCTGEAAAKIAGLCCEGKADEALRQMRRQRCTLIEQMHESQRKVDRMDHLIRRQEKELEAGAKAKEKR